MEITDSLQLSREPGYNRDRGARLRQVYPAASVLRGQPRTEKKAKSQAD